MKEAAADERDRGVRVCGSGGGGGGARGGQRQDGGRTTVNVFETALHKVRRAPQGGADDSLRADGCSSEATDAVQHGEAMRLPAKHALKKMGAATAAVQFNSIWNSTPVTVTCAHLSLLSVRVTVTVSHTGKESLLLINS